MRANMSHPLNHGLVFWCPGNRLVDITSRFKIAETAVPANNDSNPYFSPVPGFGSMRTDVASSDYTRWSANGSTAAGGVQSPVRGGLSRTTCFWVKYESNGSNMSFAAWGSDSGGRKYTIRKNSSDNLRVEVSGNGHDTTIPMGSTTINSWTWVCVVMNGDNLQDHTFYRKRPGNALHAEEDWKIENSSAATSVTLDTANTYFYLGRNGSATHYLDGWMSDVRIYDRALSAQEVYSVYLSSLKGHPGMINRGFEMGFTAATAEAPSTSRLLLKGGRSRR